MYRSLQLRNCGFLDSEHLKTVIPLKVQYALYCDINMVYLVNNKTSVILVSILSTRLQQKSSGKRKSQLRKPPPIIARRQVSI